ncbi:hypothetical protein [Halocatena marina]|uniref:hypothetical protein n=1 Tax=Halocatena marina TaxID=2934937 RepID=UPI0036F3A58F
MSISTQVGSQLFVEEGESVVVVASTAGVSSKSGVGSDRRDRGSNVGALGGGQMVVDREGSAYRRQWAGTHTEPASHREKHRTGRQRWVLT